MKVFEAIDGFLPEPMFAQWSMVTPEYERLMVDSGPHMAELYLMTCCRVAAEEHYPGIQLVDQVRWPRLNQIPIGRTKPWHVDPGIISCVYHVTPEWESGGELRIWVEVEEEPLAVKYVPNRLVIFDASLPHMVDHGEQVRYTLHVPFGIE